MRVFLTGATGFIGSAIVREMLGAGHQVLGLARSDAGAKALIEAGAEVHRGDLQDLESLKQGARNADGIIHTGFIHDFSKFKENCEIDRCAIEAMGSAIEGKNQPFVITSGSALLTPGRVSNEDETPPAGPSAHPRVASEEAAVALASKGIKSSLVRLSPTVHGDGDHGFVPLLIQLARDKGVSAYIGDGQNRWSAVHRLDAAQLFRLAFEKGEAGSRYHGAAEEGVPFKKIAEIIAKHLGVPVVSKSASEAAEHFGWFTGFAGIDCPCSSKKTQEQLGWKPSHTTLIADLDRENYFKK